MYKHMHPPPTHTLTHTHHTYNHTHTNTCTHTHAHTLTHTPHVQSHTYKYMHTHHTYNHTCTNTCTHTHTHTRLDYFTRSDGPVSLSLFVVAMAVIVILSIATISPAQSNVSSVNDYMYLLKVLIAYQNKTSLGLNICLSTNC